MKKIAVLLLVNFLYATSFDCNAQSRIVSGIVRDSITQAPLVGVSILEINSKNNSISNENGEFQLNLKNSNTVLSFSHIGYETKQITVDGKFSVKLEMTQASILLPEITVNAGNIAESILKSVIEKALKDSSIVRYHKAYYQHVSSFDGKYTRIHEVLLNTSWNNYGVIEWQPLNSRAATIDNPDAIFENFTVLCFTNSGILSRYLRNPLNREGLSKNYSYDVDSYINSGKDDEIIVISCKPKDKSSGIVFSGKFYVYTKSFSLIKMEGTYTFPSSKYETRSMTVNTKFKENKYSELEHLYITMTTKFKKKSKGTSTQRAWLYFYESIGNFGDAKKYTLKYQSDAEILKKVENNSDGWGSYVPIKHTELEKEVLKEMEHKGQFKSNIN